MVIREFGKDNKRNLLEGALRAFVEERRNGRREGERGAEDQISGPHAQQLRGQMQGRRPRGEGQGGADARQLRGLPLEGLDVRPQQQTEAILDLSDRIPGIGQANSLLYSFWTNTDHPRGL